MTVFTIFNAASLIFWEPNGLDLLVNNLFGQFRECYDFFELTVCYIVIPLSSVVLASLVAQSWRERRLKRDTTEVNQGNI